MPIPHFMKKPQEAKKIKFKEPVDDPWFTYGVYIPAATLLMIAAYTFVTTVVL